MRRETANKLNREMVNTIDQVPEDEEEDDPNAILDKSYLGLPGIQGNTPSKMRPDQHWGRVNEGATDQLDPNDPHLDPEADPEHGEFVHDDQNRPQDDLENELDQNDPTHDRLEKQLGDIVKMGQGREGGEGRFDRDDILDDQGNPIDPEQLRIMSDRLGYDIESQAKPNEFYLRRQGENPSMVGPGARPAPPARPAPSAPSAGMQIGRYRDYQEGVGAKLDKALAEDNKMSNDTFTANISDMMHVATSPGRFNSRNHFKRYLGEGVMLNVNRMTSQSLMIPQGEYVVWAIDAGKAVLIPSDAVSVDENILQPYTQYEVYTPDLLNVWNKTERILDEASSDTSFKSREPGRIHPVDAAVASAYQSTSLDQSDIADEIGVDKSTVSRWKTTGEKSGRTPSLKHALDASSLTGQPLDSMFTNKASRQSRKRKKTGGSGGGRNKAYHKGGKQDPSESTQRSPSFSTKLMAALHENK